MTEEGSSRLAPEQSARGCGLSLLSWGTEKICPLLLLRLVCVGTTKQIRPGLLLLLLSLLAPKQAASARPLILCLRVVLTEESVTWLRLSVHKQIGSISRIGGTE